MKKTFLTLLVLTLSLSAQDVELKKLEKQQSFRLKSLDTKYYSYLKKVKQENLSELKSLLAQKMKRQDLNGANEVNSAIKKIENELKNLESLKPQAFEADSNPMSRLTGMWVSGSSLKKSSRTWFILPDGMAYYNKERGQVSIAGDKVTITWKHGAVDVFTLPKGEVSTVYSTPNKGKKYPITKLNY